MNTYMEYLRPQTAHTCLHVYTLHVPVHTRPQDTLCPTAYEAQVNHVWDSCSLQSSWPLECALRPGDAPSVTREASVPLPRPKQGSRAHARIPFQQDRCLCQGSRGRSGAQPGPRWQSSRKRGHFLRLSKRALSFLPNI